MKSIYWLIKRCEIGDRIITVLKRYDSWELTQDHIRLYYKNLDDNLLSTITDLAKYLDEHPIIESNLKGSNDE